MAECIHGLDPVACDICTPRQAPEPKREPVRRTVNRTTAATRSTAPATPPVRVSAAARRLHLVVRLDELAELLAAGPLTDELGWRDTLGLGAIDTILWPVANKVERPAELAVVVSSLDDPDQIQFIAVANEPSRTKAKQALAASARDGVKLVLNPAWFTAS